MTDSTTCPVCGRKGIPDYRKGDVRCPDCESDLKAYRLIDAIEQDSKSKSTIWKPVALAAMVAALLFAILYFTKGSTPTTDKERFSLLEDSIAALNEKLNDSKANVAQATTAETKDTKVAKPEEKKEEASTSEKAEEPKAEPAKEEITAPAGKVTEKNGKKIYVVKKGDTWWGISKKLYNLKVTDAELAKMNGKKVTDKLEINQELVVK